jgi:FkbM family methyltransferase
MILKLETLNNKYGLNITGVIHVGAHYGEEHQTYKKLGINDITYFEPIPKTYKVLEERVKDATLYNFGLGDEEKEVEMFVEDLDKYGCSSILEPTSNYKGYATFTVQKNIKIKKLDSFNLNNANFLNIDVQGYELNVLKGGKDTLNHIDYVLCEVHRITPNKKLDYIGAPLIDDITKFLSHYGFELKDVNWAGVSWGDAFYIKKK